MISPYKITYNGYSNEDFDLICDLAFDSDSGETSSFLSRDAVASETYRGAIKHVSSYKFTESFTPRLTFIDKNFGDFSLERQRQILKWLTSKDTPSFINIYHDDSNVVSYAILGNFISCDSYKLGNGRVVGFQCTFESVMPFALSDLYTVTKTISDPTDNKITINIDTDDSKPVYPRITIKHHAIVVQIPKDTVYTVYSDMVPNTVYYNGSTYYWKSDLPGKCTGVVNPDYTGWETVTVDHAYTDADTWESNKIYYYPANNTYYWMDPYTFKASTTNPNLTTTSVRFTNNHTNFFNQLQVLAPTIVKNSNSTETVVLDGANKVISSSSVNRVFDADFVNWNWLPMLDGKNEITVEGNCTVTFEWREVRKPGEY